MASVALRDLWLHNANDLSDSITLWLADESALVYVLGEVRRYANGRRRTVTRVGQSESVRVTVHISDRTQYDQLKDWCGSLLMLRDKRGRKLWGSYFDLDVTELVPSTFLAVAFTFEAATYDEAV